MKEGGGNPLDAWFTDIPPRMRSWAKWFTIGAVVFGVVMWAFWHFHG